MELVLKPRPKEKGDSDMGAAREAWWNTRNAKHALRLLRNPMKSIEGKLLLSLDRLGPNAYINALESVSVISYFFQIFNFIFFTTLFFPV